MLGREPKALQIAREHLYPRQQVVPDRHRLGALEVRIGRHRSLRFLLRLVEHRARKAPDRLDRLVARIHDIETQRGGHLVVARAAGVDLAADLAERPLERRMDVLVGSVVDALSGDPLECRLHLGELGVAQEPRLPEASRVRRGRLAVIREQLSVFGAQEVPHLQRELRSDPSGPERHATSTRSRAATSCVSSAVIPMKPLAAWWGKVSPIP